MRGLATTLSPEMSIRPSPEIALRKKLRISEDHVEKRQQLLLETASGS
jgi:hypothetical protein